MWLWLKTKLGFHNDKQERTDTHVNTLLFDFALLNIVAKREFVEETFALVLVVFDLAWQHK